MFFILLLFFSQLNISLCQNRIYGGSDIDIEKVPYMVSIQGTKGYHVCGAGIISKDWALTAAGCGYRRDKANILVLSGTTNVKSGGEKHNIVEIIVHPNYTGRNTPSKLIAYNIALIKVSPPFTFNDVSQPMDLPETGKPVNDTWGLIAGWGLTNKNPGEPQLKEADILQYIIVPHVDNKNCKHQLHGLSLKNDQMCYGVPNYYEYTGGSVHCWRDTGGPLVNSDKIAFGIAIWKDQVSECGWLPGIYTDVRPYRDWIKEISGI